MHYQTKFKLINDIAKVEVTGNRRSGLEDFDGAEAWRDISKYCNKHKKTKILVISKLEGALSTLPSYDIAISLTDFGINENSKIAFVDLRKQSREVNSFTSSFVKKKGIRIEVFADEKDAFEWLSNE